MGLFSRIGSFFFSRTTPAPAPTRPEPPAEKVALAIEAGSPDLRELLRGNYAGITAGPWHRYVDAKWLGPYTPSNVAHWQRKLMRRDPQIALGMMALKSPFFGVSYRTRGGNPRTRAFIDAVLVQNRGLLDKLIASILNALDFGYQSHELLWDVKDVLLDADGEGGAPPVAMPRAYVLREASDIDPERVQILVDDRGRFAGLVVDGAQALSPVKVMHAVHQKEWRNYWGEAILDHSFNAWFWGNFLNLFLMRYLEQKGNPPLVGRAPWDSRFQDGLTPDGQAPVSTAQFMNKQAVALRGGGVITIPSEFDEHGNQLWDLQALAVGERVDQFLPALAHYEALKLRGLYVPERIATQDSSVGSMAMSVTHLDVFFGSLEVIKRFLLLATLNECVVAPLVRYNFGASAPVPYVEASELSRADKQLLTQILQKIVQLPRYTKDGRQFSVADLCDVNRMLEAVNVPTLRTDDVARESSEIPAPLQPEPNPGQDGPASIDGEPADGPPSRPGDHSAAKLARPGMGPPIVINMPSQPAPVVNVQPAAAPRVIIRQAAQPAPRVDVQVAAPNVTVQPAPVTVLPAPQVVKRVEIVSPVAGRIVGEIRPQTESG